MGRALPDTPELLQRLGLSWRWGTEYDHLFVTSSWFSSGMRPFIMGPDCPFPGLEKVVTDARRRAEVPRLHWDSNGRATLPAEIDDLEHRWALSLLRRIYHANQNKLIRGALMASPALVIYDHEVTEYPKGWIAAWAHPGYTYVRLMFRNKGLARTLRAALDGR